MVRIHFPPAESRANQWFPSSGARILETRETTEGSAELKFRIHSPPAGSRANHRFLRRWKAPGSELEPLNRDPNCRATRVPFTDNAGRTIGIAAIMRDATTRFEELPAPHRQLAPRLYRPSARLA